MKFSIVLDWVEKLILLFIVVIVLLMSTLAVVEVARRYIWGLSFPWSEELLRYLLIWLTFLGASIVLRERKLAYLDLVKDHLSLKRSFVLDIMLTFASLILLTFFCYNGFLYMLKPTIINQTSVGLGISMVWIYLSIPLGFAIMIVFSIERILKDFKELSKRR